MYTLLMYKGIQIAMSIIAILLILYSVSGGQSLENQGEEWIQYAHDAKHTWRVSYKVSISQPTIIKKINQNGKGMLLYGDYIVVYHLCNITILDAETLNKLSEFSVKDHVSSAAIYNGVVYVVGYEGIYAYTLMGELRWEIRNITGDIIQVSDEGIFLSYVGFGGEVRWISFSGEIKNEWDFGNISTPPAIFGDKLYVVTWRFDERKSINSSIYIVNLRTNTIRKIAMFENSEAIPNISVDNDGTIYVVVCPTYQTSGRKGIKLYAIDKNANLKWKFDNFSYGNLSQNPTTIIGNRHIYLLTNKRAFFAVLQFNKSNGQLLREINFNTTYYTQAFVDSSGTLYLAAMNTLYSYSPTGKLKWKIEIKEKLGEPRFRTVLMSSEKYIYLMNMEGSIYIIGMAKKDFLPLIISLSSLMIVIGATTVILWKRVKWRVK